MRNILLDTHLFLWSQFEPAKLSPHVTERMQDPDIRWHLSQISVLEIQIKYDLGKLPLPNTPEQILPDLIEKSGFSYQSLQNEAIFILSKLPAIHRDPFDRLLIATALTNGWEIATVDETFNRYPVRILS